MDDDTLQQFGAMLTRHLTLVLDESAAEVQAAAEVIVEAGRTGHLVHAAGAGHSVAGVVETFFRAGGLAHIRPLWHPDLLPLNGALRSTRSERTPGIGRAVVAEAGLTDGDVLVVFSNSGANHYPVEAAEVASRDGATTIAITSRASAARAPQRAGRRLHEVVDIVIDTHVPAGDASWPPEMPRTAPMSSIVNATIWDAVLVLVHEMAPELATWQSANLAMPTMSNEEIVSRFADAVPELAMGVQKEAGTAPGAHNDVESS